MRFAFYPFEPAKNPAEFDPRKYLGPARDNMKKLYKHKIEAVLGKIGRAHV